MKTLFNDGLHLLACEVELNDLLHHLYLILCRKLGDTTQNTFIKIVAISKLCRLIAEIQEVLVLAETAFFYTTHGSINIRRRSSRDTPTITAVGRSPSSSERWRCSERCCWGPTSSGTCRRSPRQPPPSGYPCGGAGRRGAAGLGDDGGVWLGDAPGSLASTAFAISTIGTERSWLVRWRMR